MDYRDFLVKSKLIISLFQTMKLSLDFTFSKNRDFMIRSSLFLNQITKPFSALHRITSRMSARHHDVIDVTKSTSLAL